MRSARFGWFQLDLRAGELRKKNRQIRLQNQPFQILVLLLENAGEVVSQEQIQEKLWSTDTVVEFEHSIGTALKKLRQALGDDAANPRFIETLSRRGYRWLVAVEWDEMSAAASGRSSVQVRDRGADPVPEAPSQERSPEVRLAGREQELGKLKTGLEKMLSGHRQMVFVTGEPGIGKTALVDEFARQAARRVRGMHVARGQCVEGYGGKEAYYPVLEAVGQLCRDSGREAVVDTLATQAPTWLVQFPAVLKRQHRENLKREILGATRDRMLREIGDALETISSASPLLLILEDLHWVDHSTVDLISALARRRGPARIMLVGTYRPLDAEISEHPLTAVKQDLQVHQLCNEVAITPLNEDGVTEYLAADASEASLPEGFSALMHRHSGGNPLFMVAALEHLDERGLITRDQESWKLKVPLDKIDLGVPQRLRRMIEAQIERLSTEQQRALEVASVSGVVFEASVTAAAAEMDADRLEELCEELSRRNHLVRWAGSQGAPDGAISLRYEFVHALYREVFYHRQAFGRRVKLHQRIGERLEPLYSGQKEVATIRLAYHFEAARDWARAVKYLLSAADTAGRRFEQRQATKTLEHALELVNKIPEAERAQPEIEILRKLAAIYSSSFDPRAVDTFETLAARAAHYRLADVEVRALGDMAFPLAQFAGLDGYMRAVDRIADAISRSGEGDTLKRAAWRSLYLSRRMTVGKWEAGDMEECRSVVAKLRAAGERHLLGEVRFGLCYAYFNFSEYREALRSADEGLATVLEGYEENPHLSWYYQTKAHLACMCFLFLGEWGEALREIKQRVEIVDKNGDRLSGAIARLQRTLVRLHAMDFVGAQQSVEAALPAVTALPVARRTCLILAGSAEAGLGNHERALEHLLTCRNEMDEHPLMNDWINRMPLQQALVEVWLSKGDLVNAHVEAEEFLKVTLAVGEHTYQARAFEVHARLAIAARDLDRAQDFLAKALQSMEGYEVPLAHWRVHATAFELHKLLGNHDLAESHRELSRATIMKLANSLPIQEPLRQTFLSSSQVRNILGDGTTQV
jgi:DNA-binding winged helix-turn-helix (wHTH) protein/tetratricopeptide (TPR) repeat protein